jgi:hypothetical protein
VLVGHVPVFPFGWGVRPVCSAHAESKAGRISFRRIRAGRLSVFCTAAS